jgi:hypothetical protein
MSAHSTEPLLRTAARAGAIARGVVLGVLLFAAILELLSTTDAVRLFRYQAF